MAAVGLLVSAVSPATAATVVDAKYVTITSALNDIGMPYSDPSQAYIQVAELLATDFNPTNVALASNGGTATALSNIQGSDFTGKAIDGVFPNDYPEIYHSAGTGTNEYLRVTFSSPATLSSLAVYGRSGGCCTFRDIFNFTIYDSGNQVLTSGQLDARNGRHYASVSFDAPTGAVPEPATWAQMIGGFGLAGSMIRRRKAVMV